MEIPFCSFSSHELTSISVISPFPYGVCTCHLPLILLVLKWEVYAIITKHFELLLVGINCPHSHCSVVQHNCHVENSESTQHPFEYKWMIMEIVSAA